MPVLDEDFNSRAPLPRSCGHRHKGKTVGKTLDGAGFNSSPTAAYPENMCRWIATMIFQDWVESLSIPQRGGRGPRPRTDHNTPKSKHTWAPWTSTSDEAAPWLGTNEVISAHDMTEANRLADSKGLDHCIKDGLDITMPADSLRTKR